MVYKKYIKRNGKVFGPYYCHSYRDSSGNVRTRTTYVEERGGKKVSHKIPFFVGFAFLIVFLALVVGGVFYLSDSDGVTSFTIEGGGAEAPVSDEVGEVVAEPPVEEPVEVPVEEPVEEVVEEGNETVVEDTNETEVVEEGNETISNETLVNVTETNEIVVNDSITNKTLTNETIGGNLTNETLDNQTVTNETIFVLNETEGIVELREETRQFGAVLGRPVKWEKKVRVVSDEGASMLDLTIELPDLAGNVSVTKIDEQGFENKLIANVEAEKKIDLVEPVLQITGGIIHSLLRYIFQTFRSITGFAVGVIDGSGEVVVEVKEQIGAGEEIVVEYYTDAPYSEEREIDEGKEITIVGPDEVHYEDVLAFSELPEQVASANNVNLYWIVNGSRTTAQFEAYDGDEDGLYDYIEWVVPHLSEQIYELIIINITKAVHLDSNRSLIGDVYDLVYMQDDVWFDNISSGEYLRVTFEQELDNTKDITLYARGVNGSVEVYEEDSDVLLETFENISNESLYKIYLTALPENYTQDIFDLKVIGDIDFDYVVDPQANFSSTIFQCGTIDVAGVYTLNQSFAATTTCLNITGSDVVIEGNGFNITGDGAGDYGVYSNATENVTIQNFLDINNFSMGVNFDGVNTSVIQNNTITSHGNITLYGILLNNSKTSVVFGNTILANSTKIENGYQAYGISILDGFGNNNVTNNTINAIATGDFLFNNGYAAAVWLIDTYDNVIYDNSYTSSSPGDGGYGTGYLGGAKGIFLNSTIGNATNNSFGGTFNGDVGIEIWGGAEEFEIYENSTFNTDTIGISIINGTLDLNGYYLTGITTGTGVTGANSPTVRDGFVTNFSTGVYFLSAATGTTASVKNMTVTGNVNGVQGGINANITDSTIILNTGNGIHASNAPNISVSGNTINSNGGSEIYLQGTNGGDGTYLNNNISNCSTACIYFDDADLYGSTFINNTLNSSAGYGILMDVVGGTGEASNNFFKDMNLTNIALTSVNITARDGRSAINNTFLNVSYDNESIFTATGGTAELIRKWYLDVNVTYSANVSAFEGANITMWNNTPTQSFTDLSGADGFITRQELEEYTRNGTGIYYETNYSLHANVTNDGYANLTKEVNLTESTQLDINLGVCPWEMFGIGSEADPCQVLNCDDDQSVGNFFYELQNNITGNTGSCFNITADNVTLDFNYKNITGDDSGTTDYGIYNVGYNSSTFKKGYIYDFYDAIHIGLTSTHLPNKENIITDMVLNSNKGNGIYLDSSSNNSISNVASNFNLRGLFLWHSSKNNLIVDSNFSFNDDTLFDVDFGYFGGNGNVNNTFLNVSYDSSKERVQADGSELIRKWYMDVYVDSTEGVLGGVNITAKNVSKVIDFTQMTAGSGYTTQQEVLEYINLGGTRTYATNYSVEAKRDNYRSDTLDVNFTTNVLVDFNLARLVGDEDEEPDEPTEDTNETEVNNDTEIIEDPEEDPEEEPEEETPRGTYDARTKCWGWGDCVVAYEVIDVITENNDLGGYQERICREDNGNYTEARGCELRVSIVANDVDWCDEVFVEVSHAETGKLLSRVQEEAFLESIGFSKLDISFVETNFGGYCDYCFNGVKDYDETGIDCGGSDCPACEDPYDFWNWLPLVILLCWTIFLLLILIILVRKERMRRDEKRKENSLGFFNKRKSLGSIFPSGFDKTMEGLSLKSILVKDSKRSLAQKGKHHDYPKHRKKSRKEKKFSLGREVKDMMKEAEREVMELGD